MQPLGAEMIQCRALVWLWDSLKSSTTCNGEAALNLQCL